MKKKIIQEKKEKKKQEQEKEIKQELEKLKKEKEEYLNNWKRTYADYLNLKKRTEEERKDLITMANKDLILNIIPLLDNFKRAFKNVPSEIKKSEWIEGIKQLEKQLEDILKNEGLEKIECLNQEFDPNLHEAIMIEKKKGCKKGIIIEELETGYKLNNKVIKPAKVKVAE